MRDGRLHAVIDFGCCGVGDPACDLAIAWTFLSGRSRRLFRTSLAIDDGTWVRGRAWALWKSLINLAGDAPDSPRIREAEHTLRQILAEPPSG